MSVIHQKDLKRLTGEIDLKTHSLEITQEIGLSINLN